MRKSAGLALGWHQEDVGCRINALGKVAVIGDERAHLFGVCRLQCQEHLLVLLFSLAQHDELDVIVFNNAPNALGYNVKPLVRSKTGNDGKERNVLSFGQSCLLLHSELILGFSRHTGGRKVCQKDRVALGIVVVVVDAVENAAQLVCVILQANLKTVCVFGGLDFLGIAGADCGNRIGTLDSRLHQIDAAAVLHQAMVLFAKREDVTENGKIVFALVLDVVDGENGFDICKFGQRAIKTVEINDRKCRLPIVRVQNVRVVI